MAQQTDQETSESLDLAEVCKQLEEKWKELGWTLKKQASAQKGTVYYVATNRRGSTRKLRVSYHEPVRQHWQIEQYWDGAIIIHSRIVRKKPSE